MRYLVGLIRYPSMILVIAAMLLASVVAPPAKRLDQIAQYSLIALALGEFLATITAVYGRRSGTGLTHFLLAVGATGTALGTWRKDPLLAGLGGVVFCVGLAAYATQSRRKSDDLVDQVIEPRPQKSTE